MPYRDQPPRCPRCRSDLERCERSREQWACTRCSGVLLALGTLVDELLEVAPHLLPPDRVRDVRTRSRPEAAPLPCARCEAVMEPVFLGAMPVDRCREDDLLWFDRGEFEAVLARASAQEDAHDRPVTFLRRLRALIGW